jgi:hypothetical protein
MASRLARRDDPGVRILQRAGPPRGWLLVAAVGSIVAMVAVASATDPMTSSGIWSSVAIIPVAAFLLVGLADRGGILARRAFIEYGLLQGRRLPPGYPTDADAAAAWLADPSREAEPPITRAFVLAAAKRDNDAAAELGRVDPADPADQASAERLLARLASRAGRSWDRQRFDEIANALPPDEQRWQRLSLASHFAMERVTRRQEWRTTFLRDVGGLGPWHTPPIGWFVVLSQQFTFVFVCAAVGLLLPVVMHF